MIRISAEKMSTESFAQQPALTPVEELLELSRPETSVIDWILACAVALFAIAWVWPFFRYCSFGSDEGIVLQGAARILRGEIPYRDFFSFCWSRAQPCCFMPRCSHSSPTCWPVAPALALLRCWRLRSLHCFACRPVS